MDVLRLPGFEMGPATHPLCDLVVVTVPLCASTPYLKDRDNDNAYFAWWL